MTIVDTTLGIFSFPLFVSKGRAGKGKFAGLYDKEDLNNNVATNAGRSGGVQLVLKQPMSRDFKRRLTVGDEITKALIRQATMKDRALLTTGRTLQKTRRCCSSKWQERSFDRNDESGQVTELDPSGQKMED